MHDASVIPDHQVTIVVPVNADDVLALRRMLVQSVPEQIGFAALQTLYVMNVARNVQVPAATRLVQLNQSVPAHGVRRWVEVAENLGTRRPPAVHERVCCDVVLRQQVAAQLRREVVEGGPRVGELGSAAGASGRQMCGAEQR